MSIEFENLDATRSTPFKSREAIYAAMADRRYSSSEHFRQWVSDRLDVTPAEVYNGTGRVVSQSNMIRAEDFSAVDLMDLSAEMRDQLGELAVDPADTPEKLAERRKAFDAFAGLTIPVKSKQEAHVEKYGVQEERAGGTTRLVLPSVPDTGDDDSSEGEGGAPAGVSRVSIPG